MKTISINPKKIGIAPGYQIESRNVKEYLGSEDGKAMVKSVMKHGIVSPIIVKIASEEEKAIHGQDHTLVTGAHRLGCAGKAKMTEISAILREDDMSLIDIVRVNYSTNTHARKVSMREQAEYITAFMAAWEKVHGAPPRNRDISNGLGIAPSTCSDIVAYIGSPGVVQSALRNNKLSRKEAIDISRQVKNLEEPEKEAKTLIDKIISDRGTDRVKHGRPPVVRTPVIPPDAPEVSAPVEAVESIEVEPENNQENPESLEESPASQAEKPAKPEKPQKPAKPPVIPSNSSEATESTLTISSTMDEGYVISLFLDTFAEIYGVTDEDAIEAFQNHIN